MLHLAWHFTWCTLNISRVTIYSLDVLLSQFGTSPLFHVWFYLLLPDLQISQEAGKVVWYSHLFQNFPQFVVIHIVEGFGVVNKAKVDVLLELSCFFDDPADLGNLTSGSLPQDKLKDGRGIEWEDHFLPHKFIKRSFEWWTNFTEQLLHTGGGHQAPRKSAHSLWKEVGQNIKDKKS